MLNEWVKEVEVPQWCCAGLATHRREAEGAEQMIGSYFRPPDLMRGTASAPGIAVCQVWLSRVR